MKEKKRSLNLFDTDKRSDEGYMKASESLYAFINRSARAKSEQIRNLLEQWFCVYPSEQQEDVRRRFCNKNIVQHSGAFFELYCSALLHGHGFRIEAHPNTSRNTHPEFLVYSENTPLFYLEARIATLGEIELNNQVLP